MKNSCIINPEIHNLIMSKKTPIIYTKIIDMKTWEIKILKETEDGFLCMAPNGDTQWLSHDEYNTMIENRKSL